ncbi:histidine phosphotransferase family protein [Halocynthiibacter namhaensis]|uniref:histidine phosphotransferase family protein n=1 Tax=Halocynthiibacter namhaensis TaxID=1290553 RepID=UPI000578FCD3|nr:histidine phosphotransferase family protein [Halocynthiibacter namhaensis]
MTQSDATLADLLGSRICHDLISPIGAISNGVELLEMAGQSGTNGSAEIMLISESVAHANARIRYFRLAFGTATRGQGISNSEIQNILKDYSAASRVQIDWRIGADPDRCDAKLAFLLLQCLETAMPFGGTISITEDASGWKISGRAEKMKINPELWEVISNPSADFPLKPSEVQFALAPQAAGQAGRVLTLEVGEDVGIVVQF